MEGKGPPGEGESAAAAAGGAAGAHAGPRPGRNGEGQVELALNRKEERRRPRQVREPVLRKDTHTGEAPNRTEEDGPLRQVVAGGEGGECEGDEETMTEEEDETDDQEDEELYDVENLPPHVINRIEETENAQSCPEAPNSTRSMSPQSLGKRLVREWVQNYSDMAGHGSDRELMAENRRRNSIANGNTTTSSGGNLRTVRKHARTFSSGPLQAIIKNLRSYKSSGSSSTSTSASSSNNNNNNNNNNNTTFATLERHLGTYTSGSMFSQLAFESGSTAFSSGEGSSVYEVDLAALDAVSDSDATAPDGAVQRLGNRRASAQCVLTGTSQSRPELDAEDDFQEGAATTMKRVPSLSLDRTSLRKYPSATGAVARPKVLRGMISSPAHKTKLLQRPPQTQMPREHRHSSMGPKETWGVRSLFFSKRQRKTLSACEIEHLVYIMQWYPQYLREILTSQCSSLQHLHKSLASTAVFKLFGQTLESQPRNWALDIILWNVLCNEFTVNEDIPLRGNNSATFLISAIAREPRCEQAVKGAIRPILSRATAQYTAYEQMKTRSQELAAMCIAKDVLRALLDTTFPDGIHRVCNKIRVLAKTQRDAVVGGTFFFLRYVNPAIIHFDNATERNKLFIDVTRLLQALCSSGAAATTKAEDQVTLKSPISAELFERFQAELKPEVAALLDRLCDDGTNVTEVDEMNRHMQKLELLLDMERCITKSLFSPSVEPRDEVPAVAPLTNAHAQPAAPRPASDVMAFATGQPVDGDSVWLSTTDVRDMAKAVMMHVDQHANHAERQALRVYVDRVLPYLEALVADASNPKNHYVRVQPKWFFAPPLTIGHSQPLGHRKHRSLSPTTTGGLSAPARQVAQDALLKRLAETRRQIQ